MAETPVPKSRLLVPSPKSKRPYDPVAEAQRRERYQQARRTARLGGARLPEQTFESGDVIIDFDDEMETAFFILLGRADVFVCTRMKDEDVERDKPIYELGEGDVINAELFTHDGVQSGDLSTMRIVARSKLTAVLITPHAITDHEVDGIQRRARMDFAFDTLAQALIKHGQARVLHRLDEEAHDEAIDSEREQRHQATTKFTTLQREVAPVAQQNIDLQLRVAELEAKNAELEATNTQLNQALQDAETGPAWVEVTDAKGVKSWRPPPPHQPIKKPPTGG